MRWWTRRLWMMLAAVSGFVAVAAGAIAAHAMPDHAARDLIGKGARYELEHAAAIFACAVFMQLGARRARFAPAFFLLGTLFFSGSLYALALGAPPWIRFGAPIGGTAFLIGWGILICASFGLDREATGG